MTAPRNIRVNAARFPYVVVVDGEPRAAVDCFRAATEIAIGIARRHVEVFDFSRAGAVCFDSRKPEDVKAAIYWRDYYAQLPAMAAQPAGS